MSANIKIDAGRQPKPRGRGIPRYPFRDMQPGDSFAVPIEDRASAGASASGYGQRNGQKYVSRKIDARTARIYRIT